MDLTELIKVTKEGVEVFPPIYDSIEETEIITAMFNKNTIMLCQ